MSGFNPHYSCEIQIAALGRCCCVARRGTTWSHVMTPEPGDLAKTPDRHVPSTQEVSE